MNTQDRWSHVQTGIYQSSGFATLPELFIHSRLSFQLLGHLLIVAKNVAEQESLNEGYRVGKRPTLVADKNPPADNFVHNEFMSFCPLQ